MPFILSLMNMYSRHIVLMKFSYLRFCFTGRTKTMDCTEKCDIARSHLLVSRDTSPEIAAR